MDIGEVIDATSAVSTAIGVIAALFFGVRAEIRANADRRRLDESDRRAQAARVTAWVERVREEVKTPGGSTSPARWHTSHLCLIVRNDSDAVIYGVSAPHDVDEGMSLEIGNIPPRRTVQLRIDDEDAIADGDKEPFALEFTDSAGQRWIRLADGVLSEVVEVDVSRGVRGWLRRRRDRG